MTPSKFISEKRLFSNTQTNVRFRRLFDQRLVVLIISLIVSLPTHSEVSRVASPSCHAQHDRRCSHVVAKNGSRQDDKPTGAELKRSAVSICDYD